MTLLRTTDNCTILKFVCTQCGAEDSEKIFPGETPAIAINCWKCGAGRGKDLSEMVGRQLGMFRVKEPLHEMLEAGN